jgi:hypothetical protein
MHETVVKLKDGTVESGPIWEFRPKEGYLTLGGVEDMSSEYEGELRKFYFRDMVSAVTLHERLNVNTPDGTQDELVRARKSGWDGT